MSTHQIRIRWGTSRGRDTYGYTTCSLWENEKRMAACNGGGYDMKGTVFGSWIERRFADKLRALKPEDMPEQSHWEPTRNGRGFNDGKRIDDGRYFYGLSFHDPNYDPGKAVVGEDCQDRTLRRKGEKLERTVEEAETAGQSFGLERYQAFYRASSKVPTERHTVPLIDGACGLSSVEAIFKAIGGSIVAVGQVGSRSRGSDWYMVEVAD